VRTVQQSQNNAIAFFSKFWTCSWAVQNWSVFVTISFLMPDGSLESKGSSENRTATDVENL